MFYDRRSTTVSGQPRPIRSSQPDEWSGVDLAIDYEREESDLLNANQDIGTVHGAQSIVTSLMRRMATQTGGYQRYYRTLRGVRSTGTNLENRTYSKLSSLKSDALVTEIVTYLKTAAEQDGRLDILSVSGTNSPVNQPLTFQIKYRIKGQSTIQTLDYQL